MHRRELACVLALIIIFTVALAGCGGGKSSSGSSRDIARARELATTRLARTTLAITGLGRNILTRAVGTRGSRRLGFMLPILRAGRDVRMGYDHDTQLYYVLTTNPDGSGVQLLFQDEGHQLAAGSFTWGIREWNNGQPDTYPAVLHVNFEITAGPYGGSKGTLAITLQDAAGVKCIIHIALSNNKKEHCRGDYTLLNDLFTSDLDFILADGSTCDVIQSEFPDGTIMCELGWPDGSYGTLEVNADGSTNVSITDSHGSAVNGYVDPEGINTIDYPDDYWEVWDDNTTWEDGSSNNSDDDTDRAQKIRKLRQTRGAKIKHMGRSAKR